MNLTKKQRREIYLSVAEEIESSEHFYLCGKLAKRMFIYEYEPEDISKCFPEFGLFKPTALEKEALMLWWAGGYDDEVNYNVAVRQTCMLLCAEMCK